MEKQVDNAAGVILFLLIIVPCIVAAFAVSPVMGIAMVATLIFVSAAGK